MIRLALRLLALAAALLFAVPAEAAVTFSLRTGDDVSKTQSMPIDSNNCAGSGPRAMYVGGIVTNTGGATVTNVVATISGLGSGFFLAGGQAATQSIGAIGAGQSTGVYWFVGYGCTNLATAATSVGITSSTAASTSLVTLTARSAISANAGGNVLSSTLGPGAVVGQTIYFDASYDFGGSAVGDEFFLQPSGGQAFNAACFRLVGTTITASNVTPATVGTANQLYFVQTQKQSGNNYGITVRYYFEYQCAGTSTTARPYAVQTSGNTNIKYTGNFDGAGSISLSFPGATNPFTISKASDIASTTVGTAATVKYTVTVTNPSSNASRISSFTDTLPAGATFQGLDATSDVTGANSSSVPTVNATGTLTFTGRQDQSYLIAAGGTVKLVYTVKMPSTAGTYVNSAQGQFGTATTPTVSASFQVLPILPLTVAKVSAAKSDPVNGTTNPKLIPGATAAYTITITNPNPFTVTADSVLVTDTTAANLQLYVGNISGASGGPVKFTDGAAASGLTYSYASLASTADDLEFSKDNGATWTYVPAANSQGADSLVTTLRIKPKGTMAANSSFSLLVGYVIK
ncbi:MAG TPA: isopeptide-forming domain-containing fimbrial protein [Allosphingosinicella sp.]|jgi:fimbrial isopeptide formation D2 family protein